ncbi:MAG: hypothetical protein NT166_29080 [Candidatus Aminicenantes bacterium]|nr:hypothetical protein [Candidatus Aminicenantes bacterium]
MKLIGYKLSILGLRNKKGSISISVLKEIMDALLDSSDRILRLLVEGDSTIRGNKPDWLKKSLDFIITGLQPGSTILAIDAPVLNEVIPRRFDQKEIWDDWIEQDETALTLLSKSISDAVAENTESDFLDAGVLNALLSFRPITKNYAKELRISSNTNRSDTFRISNEEIDKIKKIKIETPTSHTIVISGLFNLIEHSNRRFQLKLEDGKSIDGTMDLSLVDIENMRELWGKKVTIKGKALYRPSGKLRSIEAQLVKPFEPGEEILQRVPRQRRKSFEFVEEYFSEKNSNKSLKKIWGQWPGDESINDLLSALRESHA